jgi:hypothetical protein
MKVYLFQAELLCEPCGRETCDILTKEGKAPANLDEFDSDDFPSGPYEGDEADTPQHCGSCGVFLENPLTRDGEDYVSEKLTDFLLTGEGNPVTIREWAQFYEATAEVFRR